MSRKKMSGEKSGAKINKKRVRSLQGHIEHVCKISRSESKKRLGHSPGNKFFFFV